VVKKVLLPWVSITSSLGPRTVTLIFREALRSRLSHRRKDL
jgi:hypothetical protein